jgi:putative N6-adenine-specific DNA methylase
LIAFVRNWQNGLHALACEGRLSCCGDERSVGKSCVNNYSRAVMLQNPFEIFLSVTPGCETVVCDEAQAAGFHAPQAIPGGVTFQGAWPDVWRANLKLRGVNTVLARIAQFHVAHLAQLDKLSRQVPWGSLLHKGVSFAVDATCRKSRIYHAGAAAERVATAIAAATSGTLDDTSILRVAVRIENNLCTLSIDTSGELLHKRGHKQAVGQAPIRETLAANLLRMAGYRGDEPVIDPMCGSGTFVIEAAEIATNLSAGRLRGFAFEMLPSFDTHQWQRMKQDVAPRQTTHRFLGFDRDKTAIDMATANAVGAGVASITSFTKQAVSELQRPDGACGLVIVNPPYGARIGDKAKLGALHAALGQTLMQRFHGWRVALVTPERTLAYQTGLPFKQPGPPINHGGLRVKLYLTDPLPQR